MIHRAHWPARWAAACAALNTLACGALGSPARAESIVLGEVGRSRTVSRDPLNWLTRELSDWQPVTGQGCGASYDFTLIGTHRHNYVVLRARFARDQAQPVDLNQVRWSFEWEGDRDAPQGTEQGPAFASRDVPAAVPIHAGDELTAALPFADKEQFEGARRVRVHLVFSGCSVEAHLLRRSDTPARVQSHTVWTRTQASLSVGSGAGKLGDLDRVADNGVAFGLGFTRYLSMSHGVTVAFGFESLGGGASALGLELLVGYSYRRYLSRRWAFHYELGPGIYEYAYSRAGEPLKRLDHTWLVGQRIGVDWIFGRLNDGEWLDSDHGLGVTISHDWLPGGVIDGTSSAGHSLSLQARYTFGT